MTFKRKAWERLDFILRAKVHSFIFQLFPELPACTRPVPDSENETDKAKLALLLEEAGKQQAST